MNTESAAAYVVRVCVPSTMLAEVCGLSKATLDRLDELSVVPGPTYRIHADSVASAIAKFGVTDRDASEAYFGPAVVSWLRGAAQFSEGEAIANLDGALKAWLADDLAQALQRRGAEAEGLGWGHLFRAGMRDRDLVYAEVKSYWAGWMTGGWAVCLRRFDGHHLATKEIERQRISRLTDAGQASGLSYQERVALFDAIDRLDAVLLPFAPHERQAGTPGRFIDAPTQRHALPWCSNWLSG